MSRRLRVFEVCQTLTRRLIQRSFQAVCICVRLRQAMATHEDEQSAPMILKEGIQAL